jgi:hypothetical protein
VEGTRTNTVSELKVEFAHRVRAILGAEVEIVRVVMVFDDDDPRGVQFSEVRICDGVIGVAVPRLNAEARTLVVHLMRQVYWSVALYFSLQVKAVCFAAIFGSPVRIRVHCMLVARVKEAFVQNMFKKVLRIAYGREKVLLERDHCPLERREGA